MTTQHDAAKLYNDLQAQAADERAAAEAWQQCADSDWYRRHPDERRRAIGREMAHLNAEDRRRMGAVVYLLGGLGTLCLGLIAFLLPWAALLQWATTGDTGRYLLTLLAFGAVIVGGLVWRAGRK